MLWVNAELEMTLGKAAAQVGHAAMLLAGALDAGHAWAWAGQGYRNTVREASAARWPALAAQAPVAVRDAGFTEVAPGSTTVLAIPGTARLMDDLMDTAEDTPRRRFASRPGRAAGDGRAPTVPRTWCRWCSPLPTSGC